MFLAQEVCGNHQIAVHIAAHGNFPEMKGQSDASVERVNFIGDRLLIFITLPIPGVTGIILSLGFGILFFR